MGILVQQISLCFRGFMTKTEHNEFETIDDLPEEVQIALRAAIDGQPILTLPAEFDQFDPITAEAPYELQNVTRRARELLVDADRDLIRSAVTFADIATTIVLVDLASLERSLTEEEVSACSGTLDELRPIALFHRLRLIDELRFKPKELPWYVVFASLSLAYVARSVNNGVNHGIEATEALAKAEVLYAKSHAGKASRHVDNDFKQLLREFIAANPGLASDLEYARGFIGEYSDEMINRRSSAYVEKTIVKWITETQSAQESSQ